MCKLRACDGQIPRLRSPIRYPEDCFKNSELEQVRELTFAHSLLVQVESLFHNYQKRRNSRVNVLPDDIQKDVGQPQCESGSQSTPQSESSSRCIAECPPASDVK